eukprot:m.883598 g.883598  ORF g.883598 m.883598 type:complete len:1092 (+) comp59884_c0_seq2:68-3343(+)
MASTGGFGGFYVASSEGVGVVGGCFTGELGVAVARLHSVELMAAAPDGLHTTLRFPVHARIAHILPFRPQGEELDWLCITTDANQFCLLAYDVASKTLVTKAKGDATNRMGRAADCGQLLAIDPNGRCIAIYAYEGLLKLIPVDSKGRLQEAFDVPLQEFEITSLAFLHGMDMPTVAITSTEDQSRRVLTYKVHVRNGELTEGPWAKHDVDGDASLLIPVSKTTGGCIIVGSSAITYFSAQGEFAVGVSTTAYTCFGRIDADGSRVLLGTLDGELHLVVLERDANADIRGIRFARLGRTVAASSLAYVDEGVVFVASLFGDSKVIKLSTTEVADGRFFEELASFSNIGPIIDMCVMELDRKGQTQVVTCSGARQDGSLRIIRNGIGILEGATLDMPSLQGIWALRHQEATPKHDLLALSFLDQTAFLAINGEELEGVSIEGASSTTATLFCGNVSPLHWTQVSESSVRLISCSTGTLAGEWIPPNGRPISSCAAAGSLLLVASAADLFLLDLSDNIVLVTSAVLQQEISCVDLQIASEGRPEYAAVGLWTDLTVRLLRIPSLEEISQLALGGTVIARSLALTEFDGVRYLLTALGDGSLQHTVISPASYDFGESKKVTLALQPIELRRFPHNGSTHVFASSDRPCVIYSNHKQLLFSSVNVQEVKRVCALDAEAFPNSLVLVNSTGLTIGKIDEIQKLQIDSVPLGESPLRVAHQASSQTICVATLDESRSTETCEGASYLRLFNSFTFERLDSVALKAQESPSCIISCSLAETPYFVVGTAIVNSQEDEPSVGFISVYSVVDARLHLEFTIETAGAPNTISPFRDGIAVGVRSKLVYYKFTNTDSNKQLKSVASFTGHVMVLFSKAIGNHVLIGDLMRSVSLLNFDETKSAFEMIGLDHNPNWMTAVTLLPNDVCLGCESSFNLFACMINEPVEGDKTRQMEICGQFHLGDFINALHPGSLATKTGENAQTHAASQLFGTVGGSIGSIIPLTVEQYDLFSMVQVGLGKVVGGVGGFSQEAWRSPRSRLRVALEPRTAHGFIDGNYVETFLALSRPRMQEVVENMTIAEHRDKLPPLEQIVKLLEEFACLH